MLLIIAVGFTPDLQVSGGVPVNVVEDNSAGACEVEPRPPGLGAQEEHPRRGTTTIERVNNLIKSVSLFYI